MFPKIEDLYIFEGLSEQEVAFFLLMSQTEQHKKGHIIMSVGDISDGRAYYINSGRVQVIIGGHVVAELGPGAFFGEIALIADDPRNATIQVAEPTELQVFMKDDFLTLIRNSVHSQEIQEEIMRRIKERLKK